MFAHFRSPHTFIVTASISQIALLIKQLPPIRFGGMIITRQPPALTVSPVAPPLPHFCLADRGVRWNPERSGVGLTSSTSLTFLSFRLDLSLSDESPLAPLSSVDGSLLFLPDPGGFLPYSPGPGTASSAGVLSWYACPVCSNRGGWEYRRI